MIGLSGESRVRCLVDISARVDETERGEGIRRLVHELSATTATRAQTQKCIRAITAALVGEVYELLADGVVLVPVLRAGLAMWITVNDILACPECSFVLADRLPDTFDVSVVWPKPRNITGKRVVLLDPIIATGSTLSAVCARLKKKGTPGSLLVLSCYAAPEGIRVALNEHDDLQICVGCLAKTVGGDGRVVPLTHGDMGDKLFGPASCL